MAADLIARFANILKSLGTLFQELLLVLAECVLFEMSECK
jgi:hypothetical protein